MAYTITREYHRACPESGEKPSDRGLITHHIRRQGTGARQEGAPPATNRLPPRRSRGAWGLALAWALGASPSFGVRVKDLALVGLGVYPSQALGVVMAPRPPRSYTVTEHLHAFATQGPGCRELVKG